jgi:hypothetical protein
MEKLILLAVVILSFAVPIWYSKAPAPRRTLRRIQWFIFASIIVWSYLCLHWYPRLVHLE